MGCRSANWPRPPCAAVNDRAYRVGRASAFAALVCADLGCGRARVEEGEVIAWGTTEVDSYGTTPRERAVFIVDTIRVHLRRGACNLHAQDLSSIGTLLGCEVRWCPSCGTRLSID
jgi:hypothetical protein